MRLIHTLTIPRTLDVSRVEDRQPPVLGANNEIEARKGVMAPETPGTPLSAPSNSAEIRAEV